MEFQRGSDIKEAIKVGMEANSYELYGLHVMSRFPIDDRTPSNKSPKPKWKGFSTDLVDEALVKFLEMLDEKGLNIEFHEELLTLMKKAFVRAGNIPRLFDVDRAEIRSATFVYREDEADIYRQNGAIPRFFGKFMKYQGKYYEIKDDTKDPGYWNE